ncbi:MAG: DUF58 domain-containing protein [bacterium]|nr:DUF58 domain-containing protein [bacterium]
MIPKEILRKVRRIQIHTTRVVRDVFAGEYQSVFKGRGMEFEEVREYQVGDDVRAIDWNVTARTGRPHVKLFREERELTVMILADVSASGAFGTRQRLKGELIAEFSAAVAFAAITNNDKVGLILFSDRVEKYIPPKKGVTHVLRVIRELLSPAPRGRGTDIGAALEFLSTVTTRTAIAFLVSDFLDTGYERALRLAARRHDLVAVRVADRREEELPPIGLVEMEDPESGERALLDTGDPRLRRACAGAAAERSAALDRFLRAQAVDRIGIETGEPYAPALLGFFRMRERRMAT